MATMTAQTGPEAAADAPAKKKQRLNPARRKALKAKAEAMKAQAEAIEAAKEAQSPKPPDKQDVQPLPSNPSQPAINNLSKRKTSLPASLSRQNTEPLTNARKPNLTRSVTAPSSSGSKSKSLALTAPALVTGGLVGCAAGAAILLGVGIWYDFSCAESAILTAKAAKLCVDNLAEEIITSLRAGTYSGDEALDMLRRTTLAYASTIPEGAPFVERMFREIDMVRKQRGREIDKVVAETHTELSKAGKRGATPVEMRSIVVRQLMKLSSFASKATQDVVARNPTLRPYRDEAARSLRQPETKVPTVRVNMAVRQKQATGS